jgi:hypothetical protein
MKGKRMQTARAVGWQILNTSHKGALRTAQHERTKLGARMRGAMALKNRMRRQYKLNAVKTDNPINTTNQKDKHNA